MFIITILGFALFLLVAPVQAQSPLPSNGDWLKVSPSVPPDGSWWKIRVSSETELLSRSGYCFEQYVEYLVKRENGKTKIFIGDNQEIDCSDLVGRLLGIGGIARLRLPLPLQPGFKDTFRTPLHPFADVTIEVSKEMVKAPLGKKTHDAYEVKRVIQPIESKCRAVVDRLLYSQECNCNLLFERTAVNEKTKVVIKIRQEVQEFGF